MLIKRNIRGPKPEQVIFTPTQNKYIFFFTISIVCSTQPQVLIIVYCFIKGKKRKGCAILYGFDLKWTSVPELVHSTEINNTGFSNAVEKCEALTTKMQVSGKKSLLVLVWSLNSNILIADPTDLRKTGIAGSHVYLQLLLPLFSFLLLLLGCSFNFHTAMLSRAKRLWATVGSL